jgi:hypothetical protein
MLKSVNNIYKPKSHELGMSLKKNVVGGLKIWKYFRARFAEARPLGYPAWSYRA